MIKKLLLTAMAVLIFTNIAAAAPISVPETFDSGVESWLTVVNSNWNTMGTKWISAAENAGGAENLKTTLL